MATRKRREKSPNGASLRGVTDDAGDDQPIKAEVLEDNAMLGISNTTSGMGSCNSEHGSPYGAMSLDVLAQVATATLENEPRSEVPGNRKLTKRSVQSLDVLTLEQIRMLSDKALVNMFAEMTANEMTKNYTYQCFLMPKRCQEKFTSFGNENRARLRVRSHLLGHIGELLQESSTQGRGRIKFTAEPLPARKKRLQAEKTAQKKIMKRKKEAAANKHVRSPGRRTGDDGFTSLRSTTSQLGGRNMRSSAPETSEVGFRQLHSAGDSSWTEGGSDSGSGTSPNDSKKSNGTKGGKKTSYAKKNIGRRFKKRTPTGKQRLLVAEKVKAGHADNNEDSADTECRDGKEAKSKKFVEGNEQFILDLLSRSQPYHDHNYTTIFGKRYGIESLDLDQGDLEDDETAARSSGIRLKAQPRTPVDDLDTTPKTLTLKVPVNAGMVPTVNNVHIPIIRLARIPVAPDGTPLVSAEEVVIQESDTLDDLIRKHEMSTTSAARPYPPMPKSELARRGKVVVPEEEMSSSEEEQVEAPTRKVVRDPRRVIEGSAEWERKMALRCIRELRCTKKEDTVLVCKICTTKSFTATATLMYHYRSHAGIKPFVCLICNTTFTRQHSLNYHMLIHNNQSRFTCKDCGRKFRHPSHFKEHLRRHTGETPFHCTDCPLRFKTRNTYKRHLKTRHGKLLTAKGIRQMPRDEFLKVRTKPYNYKGPGGSDEEDEEEDFDEDEDIDSGDQEQNQVETEGNDERDGLVAPNRLLQFCTQVVSQEVL